MEKKRNVIAVYALIVNIVAVITFIICISTLTSALIDRSDPLYAGYSGESLASFDTYKMNVMKESSEDQAYLPDDATLRSMYEAAKDDKIKRTEHSSYRTILVSSLIIFLALVLFGTHYYLLRKNTRNA